MKISTADKIEAIASATKYLSSRQTCAEELARVMRSRQSLSDFLSDALAEELESLSLAPATTNPASSQYQ